MKRRHLTEADEYPFHGVPRSAITTCDCACHRLGSTLIAADCRCVNNPAAAPHPQGDAS